MRSVAAAAFLFLAMPLTAATFTVSQNTDDGTGSFRWAILGANATPGPDAIVFSQYPMTIRLSAPLPPITDEVAIYPVEFGATVVIDGSSAGDADGLVVNSSAVHVEGLALINFTGDGLVANGDNGDFNLLSLSNNRNGARIAGRNNALYGSKIEKNREAGVWVTSEASGNVISRYDPGPNQLVPWLPSQSDTVAGNRDGIVLDGIQNTVLGATITSDVTVPPNSGAGVVVNGARNWVVQSEITGQLPRYAFTVSARPSPSFGVPDPDLSNNTVTVSVAVESRTRAVRH